MKRFCYILFALLLALSVLLISCKDGADSNDSSEATSGDNVQPETTVGETIGGGDEFENDNDAQYKDEWN